MNLYGKAPRFIPANSSRAFIRAGYGIASLLAQTRYKVEVNIPRDDLSRLDDLSNSRSIILPNHPTPSDWLTMYMLSSRLSRPFHFMTAHEQFFGTRRFWLPKFGAYSIRRGGWGDFSSVVETLRLLQTSTCSLVLFPEGRCTFSSRDVLEFKCGAVKIGFNCLKRLTTPGDQDLFLVPAAIRYQYLESIDATLIERIERLDHWLATSTTGTACDRLCHLVQEIVVNLEDQFELETPDSNSSWRERIMNLCNGILRISEQAMGMGDGSRAGLMNRACNVRQVLALQGYCRGIETRALYEQAYFPTLLVLVLESIAEIDLSRPLSSTMLADLLYSLERIVYRIPDPVPLGRREAIVRVGEMVNLKHWLDDYHDDKQRITRRLLKILQADVKRNLKLEIPVADTAAQTLELQKLAAANENSTDYGPR